MQVYKAIKYIRLSYTDDKTVESDSVANQRRLIDDYIARHPEIEVVAEKIDDGYSGVLFDRPAFQEMMRMIEQGEANCVIVKDLSRLGREYIETGRYMRRVFPAYGVRFIATYRTRKAVYDTELVQAKNVHAVITAQTKQIKSDYEIKLKQQEIMQEVGNANMLTKALIDRLINKVYVFPGDRIEIEYATQDFLETKESEKEV